MHLEDTAGIMEKLVLEWMSIHIDELREMWNSQSFKKIEPLE